MIDILREEYNAMLETESDIKDHLSILKQYADQCYTVVELGTRTGISTRALLASDAKTVCSYDLELNPRVMELFKIAVQTKNVRYLQADSRYVDIPQTDLLFIDTDHTYALLSAELKKHHTKVNKYIAFHDTQTYGVKTEKDDPGLMPAIFEFMRDHPEWKVDYFTTKNNGFTVLKKGEPEPVKNKRILIAIPTNRYIESDTFKAIYDLEKPQGYEIELQCFYGYQVDQIRNLIAEWGKHYDYLFCVDSDIVMPKDTLVKMIASNKDVVSGLYIQRIPNTHTLELYKWMYNRSAMINIPIEELTGKGLVEVAGCGFGCVLINSDVIRKMEYPHFVYKSALDHRNTLSEDVYFCMKAVELGFSVWADTTILCDHVGQSTYTVQTKTINNGA